MNERFADGSALQLSYKIYNRNAGSEPLLPWLDMNHDQLYHMLVAQVCVCVGCNSLVEVLSMYLFIYGLCNAVASCLGYIISNGKMNST